jgi:hypothetical protein
MGGLVNIAVANWFVSMRAAPLSARWACRWRWSCRSLDLADRARWLALSGS